MNSASETSAHAPAQSKSWSDISKVSLCKTDYDEILGFELLDFFAKDSSWAYQNEDFILLLQTSECNVRMCMVF